MELQFCKDKKSSCPHFSTLIFGLNSCKKELLISNPAENDKKLTLTELKKITNKYFIVKSLDSIKCTPNWLKAYSINLKNGSNIIHVSFAENIYQAYNNAQSHLVAYKDSTGKIETAIMVIRPADGDVSKIPANTTLKNFTGDIMLYTLNETFIRGHALVNGKIKGEIKIENSDIAVNMSILNKLNKVMDITRAGSLNQIQAWEEQCEWRQGPSYVNSAGEVVIVSRRYCSWHYRQPDAFLPEEETIDYIEPLPTYGGEIITDEITKKIISKDTSITNNIKAKCALEKLLNDNVKFDSLLLAFTGAGYNLTFKVESIGGDTLRGGTTYDPYNQQNFKIVLNRSFVNSAKPIQIAKTLLHEAFHANLMQRAYQVFGNGAVNTWVKKPGEMSLNELIDVFEEKVAGTTLETVHHEYMAKNINIIVAGLKEFAQKHDSNYLNYDEYDYQGLAWEGLRKSRYFIENVQFTQIYYVPNTTVNARADSLFDNRVIPMLNSSQIICNP